MTFKLCTICKKQKLFSEFNKKNNRRDGMQPHCRECNRVASRKYYRENREHHKQAARKRNIRVKKINQEWIFKFLNAHPCIDCGENDPLVLEFDHQSNKTLDVSFMIAKSYSLNSIMKEIEKCNVRCANCHRRRTNTLNKSYRFQLTKKSYG